MRQTSSSRCTRSPQLSHGGVRSVRFVKDWGLGGPGEWLWIGVVARRAAADGHALEDFERGRPRCDGVAAVVERAHVCVARRSDVDLVDVLGRGHEAGGLELSKTRRRCGCSGCAARSGCPVRGDSSVACAITRPARGVACSGRSARASATIRRTGAASQGPVPSLRVSSRHRAASATRCRHRCTAGRRMTPRRSTPRTPRCPSARRRALWARARSSPATRGHSRRRIVQRCHPSAPVATLAGPSEIRPRKDAAVFAHDTGNMIATNSPKISMCGTQPSATFNPRIGASCPPGAGYRTKSLRQAQ